MATLSVRALQPWPLGLEPICELHLLAEGPRVFVSSAGDFLRTTPFSRYRRASHLYFSRNARNFAVFRLPLQLRLVRYT